MTDDENTHIGKLSQSLGFVDPYKDPHTIVLRNDINRLHHYRQGARHVLAHESSHTAKAQEPGWFKNTKTRVMPVQPTEQKILDRVNSSDSSASTIYDLPTLLYLNYFGNPDEVSAHARAFKAKYAEKTGTPWMPGDRQDPEKWKIMRDEIIGNVGDVGKIQGEFFGSEEGEKVMDLAKRGEQKTTPQAVAENTMKSFLQYITEDAGSPHGIPRYTPGERARLLALADQAPRADYAKLIDAHGGDWQAAQREWISRGHAREDAFGDASRQPDVDALVDTHGAELAADPEHRRNAWLLVQHRDSAPDVQKKYLKHLEDAGATDTDEYRYLTDRIAVNSGRPQVYGTQRKFEPDDK